MVMPNDPITFDLNRTRRSGTGTRETGKSQRGRIKRKGDKGRQNTKEKKDTIQGINREKTNAMRRTIKWEEKNI